MGFTNRWVIPVALSLMLVAPSLGHPVAVNSSDEMRFHAASADTTGLDYRPEELPPGIDSNKGVYVTDYNTDSWPDVLAVGGGAPVLFENVGGEFKRSNALPEIDVLVKYALFFDSDTDGDEDLLLLPESGTPLFLENLGQSFERRPSKFRENLTKPMAATAADFDADGSLELFIVQHGDWNRNAPSGYSGPVENDNGHRNLLFDFNGSAYESVRADGITGDHWSFAVSAVDLNDDEKPDIHVANDFYYDKIYINEGNGTFQGQRLQSTNRNGMSSEIADVNNDLRPDILVTNIFLPYEQVENKTKPEFQGFRRRFKPVLGKLKEGNNLLINGGNGSFTDEAEDYGVKKGGWGWAAAFADFDNDGDEDLFHTTSIVLRVNDSQPHYTYPMVWERAEDGFVSKDASGAGFEETRGRGAATLDFDRDGDMDLIVATVEEKFRLYENTNRGGNSFQIRIQRGGKTPLLGTEVYVTVDEQTRYWSLNPKADYLSQDTRIAHFGLGATTQIDRVRVVWPDGRETVLRDIEANRRYSVSPGGLTGQTEFNRTG